MVHTDGPSEAEFRKMQRSWKMYWLNIGWKGKLRMYSLGLWSRVMIWCLRPGIKSQRVIALADDVARSMAAMAVRMAVVPGQNVIGIELPTENRETVLMRDILDGMILASA